VHVAPPPLLLLQVHLRAPRGLGRRGLARRGRRRARARALARHHGLPPLQHLERAPQVGLARAAHLRDRGLEAALRRGRARRRERRRALARHRRRARRRRGLAVRRREPARCARGLLLDRAQLGGALALEQAHELRPQLRRRRVAQRAERARPRARDLPVALAHRQQATQPRARQLIRLGALLLVEAEAVGAGGGHPSRRRVVGRLHGGVIMLRVCVRLGVAVAEQVPGRSGIVMKVARGWEE
jgi:hypothetical protein